LFSDHPLLAYVAVGEQKTADVNNPSETAMYVSGEYRPGDEPVICGDSTKTSL